MTSPADTFKTAEHAAAQTANTTANVAGDAAKASTEKVSTAGAAAFKDGIEKSLAGLTELNAQSQQNLDAFLASATAKGAESLNAQALAYGKTAVDKHVEAVKAIASARSAQEAIELQSNYAKSALETYIAEMTHASETISNLWKTAFRPLNERATAAVQTLQAAR